MRKRAAPSQRRRSQQSASASPPPKQTPRMTATDGFFALVSDYDAYTTETLMQAAASKGLSALGEELRAIEMGDPEGRRFARFKRHDDATALLLRVDD